MKKNEWMNENKSVAEGYTEAPIAPIIEHRDQWYWFFVSRPQL